MRTRAMIALGLLVAGVLGPGAHAGSSLPPRLDPVTLEGASPRAIALFSHEISHRDIRRLAAADVTHAGVFEAINAAALVGPREAYIEIARWSDVVRVQRDAPISFNNYIARDDTGVDDVRAGKGTLKTGYTGKGVTVAVVDTGIDTSHPDMSNVAVTVEMEPAWFMDDITDGEYSESYAEQPIGTDPYGHGTHVAGIVGGTGAAGINVDQSGVAPGATLVNCKMFSNISLAPDNPTGIDTLESNALACYDWILAHRKDPRFPGGIRIVTNSWGLPETPDKSDALMLMLQKVVARGVSVVFAAGNAGPDDDTVSYPANTVDELITVGSVCKSIATGSTRCEPREVASNSSRGKQLDVTAPGVSVWSARAKSVLGTQYWDADGPWPGGPDPASGAPNQAWYMPGSGTSMAAPHVAGIVALMIEANPRLKPARIEAILTRTATDQGARGFDHDYGFGVVDAFSAVRAAVRAR